MGLKLKYLGIGNCMNRRDCGGGPIGRAATQPKEDFLKEDVIR